MRVAVHHLRIKPHLLHDILHQLFGVPALWCAMYAKAFGNNLRAGHAR